MIMRKVRFRTLHLAPSPSFLVGAGSVLNIAGNYFEFNYSSSAREADSKALLSDWGVIGQDILNAKVLFEKELQPTVCK